MCGELLTHAMWSMWAWKEVKETEFGQKPKKNTPKRKKTTHAETHDSIPDQWKCRGIFDLVAVEFFIG